MVFAQFIFLVIFISQFYDNAECISFFHFTQDPPPVRDIALMSRYIVHHSDWATLSYLGNQSFMDGMPMGRVYSVSDGTINNSSGVPYIMASPMDLSFQDVVKTKNCSLVLSLAQSDYCKKKSYDPEDPRCAQLTLTGKFVKLDKDDPEWNVAKTALWTRHPVMRKWHNLVPGHHWQFAKINIEHITLIDTFGGRKYPTIAEYFKATPTFNYWPKLRHSVITVKKNVIIDEEFIN
ncbi:protein CREG1-like isoform X1 [Aphis craccivora]|uniref:Protein CREG1-like isoform X1 n=1 Tax=Aphis craccivora TaxID=307492 RepID=A0A6G0YL16_APHCR|nr:protein CREG1-like isoform X1 [Aphis craccivora]